MDDSDIWGFSGNVENQALADTLPIDRLLVIVEEHHPLLKGLAYGSLTETVVDRMLVFMDPRRNSRLTDPTRTILDRCFPAFRAEAIDLVDRALAYGLKHSNAAHAAASILAVVFRHRLDGAGDYGPDEVLHQVISQALSRAVAGLYSGEAHDKVKERAMDALYQITASTLVAAWMNYQNQRVDPSWVTHDADIHRGFVWPTEPASEGNGNVTFGTMKEG